MCNYEEEKQAEKYRIARGKFQDAIKNFNNAVKDLEIQILRYLEKDSDGIRNYQIRCLAEYIHDMHMELTEEDTIILFSKKKFYDRDNERIEFEISKDKKVTDAIKFYDEYLMIIDNLKNSTIFSENLDISKNMKSVFEELKQTFFTFADI